MSRGGRIWRRVIKCYFLTQSYVTVNATAALNIFRLALNSGWSQAERAVIVDETWRIIEQIAGTLFEDYLVTGINSVSFSNYSFYFIFITYFFNILSFENILFCTRGYWFLLNVLRIFFFLFYFVLFCSVLLYFNRKWRPASLVPRHNERHIRTAFLLKSFHPFLVLTFAVLQTLNKLPSLFFNKKNLRS